MSETILTTIPAQPYKWSGARQVPAIGERVTITFNELNTGSVIGYLVTDGYLGVWIKLDKNPEWRERQGHDGPALVYGAEIKEQRA